VEIWRCLARPESGGGDSSIRNHGSWWSLRDRSGEWRGEKRSATDTSAWVVSCNTSRRGLPRRFPSKHSPHRHASERVTNRVTIAIASSERQRTPADGRSQVRHAAALAVRAAIWLRDEEANASERAPVTRADDRPKLTATDPLHVAPGRELTHGSERQDTSASASASAMRCRI
jgi:hypothetical protein